MRELTLPLAAGDTIGVHVYGERAAVVLELGDGRRLGARGQRAARELIGRRGRGELDRRYVELLVPLADAAEVVAQLVRLAADPRNWGGRPTLDGFERDGEWHELRDPDGSPSGRQLLALNYAGRLELVGPGLAEPLTKGEAAAAIATGEHDAGDDRQGEARP